MRVPVALLIAAMTGAECQRAPAEDFPQRAVEPAPPASAAGTPAPSDTNADSGPERSRLEPSLVTPPLPGTVIPEGRCILPTPAEPPPPVPPGPAADCPADPEGQGKLPVARITFPDSPGTDVEAEVVVSEHDSMRGLMYRKSLGADRGMLFDLGSRDDHKFWMHNTCIPLDLLYIDDGIIVGIVENAPTLNDESRGVGCPSRWVLEVNAGWSRRHKVKAGQRIKLR